MVNMFYHYPVMTTIWSNVNRQEQNVVAYQKVEEVLVAGSGGLKRKLFFCAYYPFEDNQSKLYPPSLVSRTQLHHFPLQLPVQQPGAGLLSLRYGRNIYI